MRKLFAISTGLLLNLACVGGCTHPSSEGSPDKKDPAKSSINWLEQGLDVNGMAIAVGHLEQTSPSDGWLEPAVAITKEGKPVADAMVFCRLVTAAGETTLGDEVATVFAADSDGKSASYAQGKLRLPADDSAVAVRYRIILPGVDEEWTRDVILKKVTTAK